VRHSKIASRTRLWRALKLQSDLALRPAGRLGEGDLMIATANIRRLCTHLEQTASSRVGGRADWRNEVLSVERQVGSLLPTWRAELVSAYPRGVRETGIPVAQ
jgi:hypothetical protein